MGPLFVFLMCLFPRLTLAFAYFFGFMPENSTPFPLDVLCFLIIPEFLVAFWLYEANAHPLLIGILVFVAGLKRIRSGIIYVRGSNTPTRAVPTFTRRKVN